MIKRRWLWLGLLVAAIAGVVLTVLALLPPRPGITKENFDRIEEGMTRPEVEAILGGPANVDLMWFPDEWENRATGDLAIIRFDQESRVSSKQWDGWPDDRTVWQNLLDHIPGREPPPRARPRLITL